MEDLGNYDDWKLRETDELEERPERDPDEQHEREIEDELAGRNSHVHPLFRNMLNQVSMGPTVESSLKSE